jgi:hypothetical protein
MSCLYFYAKKIPQMMVCIFWRSVLYTSSGPSITWRWYFFLRHTLTWVPYWWYAGWSKSLCAPDDYNTESYKKCSKRERERESVCVSRQSPDVYWHAALCSRRPCSVQHGPHSKCILWWPSSNRLLCGDCSNTLYCNRQVHSDFLITLYHRSITVYNQGGLLWRAIYSNFHEYVSFVTEDVKETDPLI